MLLHRANGTMNQCLLVCILCFFLCLKSVFSGAKLVFFNCFATPQWQKKFAKLQKKQMQAQKNLHLHRKLNE